MSPAASRFSYAKGRAQAHAHASDGIAILARAFNRFDAEEVPYRYTRAVQDEFFRLSVQIAQLIEHGPLEPNPAHDLYRRAIEAKSDKTLQQVLQGAAKRRVKRAAAVFKGQSS